MPTRAAPSRVGVPRPGRPRGRRRATTWSAWAPTSSPGTLLAAYRRGLFPMPGRRPARPAMLWWSPVRRGVLPARRAAGLALAAAVRAKHFEIRVDTAFDEVIAGLRRPGRDRTAGSTAGSSPPTRGCTSSAGRTRSRRGRTASSSAACTASRSAACSPASRCSTGSRDASKVALVGLVDLLQRRARRPSGCSTCSGATAAPRLARRGRGRRAGTYLARLERRGWRGGVPAARGAFDRAELRRAEAQTTCGARRLADHRPAGGLPVEHAAVEVDRVVALLHEVRRWPGPSGRRPCRPPAAWPSAAPRRAGRGSSRSGMCTRTVDVAVAATRRARARRARAAPRAAGRGRRSMATVGMFRIMASGRLLEQPGHPPVGERLAAGLAGRAVLQERVGERHLAHHVAAHRARRARCARAPPGCSSSRP